MESPGTGIVVIGRNEGARLIACFGSLAGAGGPIVYVDSGSTDGSVEAARGRGIDVVELDMGRPFTAARARDAGFDRLMERWPSTRLVQFVDGDCAVAAGWLGTATAFLDAHDDVVAVFGRRRERFPGASVYNWMCDIEWDRPVGDALSFGGDVLLRARALREAGGYDPTLIAGEEPELCVRLRARGWKVRRIDAEMTLHDAAITRFSQWWKRARRAGHAYVEVCLKHRRSPYGIFRRETLRAALFGGALPAALVLASLANPWWLLGLAIYPLRLARTALRCPPSVARPWTLAFFLTLGQFAEAEGMLRYALARLRGRRERIMEYK